MNKEMPRIPCVRNFDDFKMFSEAGRKLADLHINYETVPMYKAEIESLATEPSHYRVEKMAYGKKKDLSTLVYNSRITLKNIPLEAISIYC